MSKDDFAINLLARIPHFLYIDEFSDFICKDTEAMFTMYRKYRVATTISAQSISQFALPSDKTNFNIIGNDIQYQEGILEMLEKTQEINLIIISELLI